MEGELLGWGASVGRTAFLVETTFVTDADRVGIVVAGMSSNHLLWTTEVELAVASDVEVVATALPATGLVHLVKLLQRNVLVGARGSAVNDNQIYSSHILHRISYFTQIIIVTQKSQKSQKVIASDNCFGRESPGLKFL